MAQASKALSFPHLYGLTVRFAMKACPNAAILKIFKKMGINFDASSGYEVLRAVRLASQLRMNLIKRFCAFKTEI